MCFTTENSSRGMGGICTKALLCYNNLNHLNILLNLGTTKPWSIYDWAESILQQLLNREAERIDVKNTTKRQQQGTYILFSQRTCLAGATTKQC